MGDMRVQAGDAQKGSHDDGHERSAPSRFGRFKALVVSLAVAGTVAAGYTGCGSDNSQDVPNIPADAGCTSDATDTDGGCVQNDGGVGGMDAGQEDAGHDQDSGTGGMDAGHDQDAGTGGDGGAPPVDGGVTDGGMDAGTPCPGVFNDTRTGAWPKNVDEAVGGYNVRYLGPVSLNPVFDIRCAANGNPVRLGETVILFSVTTVNVPEDSKKAQFSLNSANLSSANGSVSTANYP